MAERLGVSFSVVEPALEFLKGQHQVEVAGGAITGAASYRYRITDAGRTRVALFLQTNQYVGVAPVPYEQYPTVHGELHSVGAANRHPGARARGAVAPGREPASPRSARPGDQLRPLDVRLRASRKWQDGHRAGRPQAAVRRDRHTARDRGGRGDHPPLRPGQSRADCRGRGRRAASSFRSCTTAAGSAASARW